jgi:hypothetical protein
MSTNVRAESKNSGMKALLGAVTRNRVLVSAGAMGVGAVSLSMVPAMTNAVVALGGFAVHNPILLGAVALFAIGQSVPFASRDDKAGKNSGAAWVACGKCNRAFRDRAEVERHSAGYHV